jgi:hydrogenase maturation protease
VAVVRVIGCGNLDAGDDGAGVLAVAGARPALEALSGVEVVPSASPSRLVDLLRNVDAVLIVDAVRTSPPGAAGTIVRVEAGRAGLPAGVGSSLSSHGVGIAEAVGLAAALGSPPRVVVLGVEAGPGNVGGPLSEPVRGALPELERRIVAEARELSRVAERSPVDGPTGPRVIGGPGPR